MLLKQPGKGNVVNFRRLGSLESAKQIEINATKMQRDDLCQKFPMVRVEVNMLATVSPVHVC